MLNNPNDRQQLSDGAGRVFSLYGSDTAYHFALRLAVLLCLTVLFLRFVLR